jgi:hypothetical protein
MQGSTKETRKERHTFGCGGRWCRVRGGLPCLCQRGGGSAPQNVEFKRCELGKSPADPRLSAIFCYTGRKYARGHCIIEWFLEFFAEI